MLTRKTPLRRSSKPMKRTPLRRVSAKLAKERRIYTQEGKEYWKDGRLCVVALSGVLGEPRERPATDRHHLDGRHGKKLNEKGNVIPVSREGHDWIRDNGNAARERGWLK